MSLAIALGLNKAGHVTLEQIEEAMNAHILYGGSLLYKLVELGYLNDRHLAEYLSREFNITMAGADDFANSTLEARAVIPVQQAWEKHIFPLKIADSYLYLAMFDPTRQEDLEQLAADTNLKIMPLVAPDSQIKEAIQHFYIDGNISDLEKNQDIGSDLEENWEHQVTEDMNELNFGDCGGDQDDGDDDDDEAFSRPPENTEESFTYASFEFAEDEGEDFSIDSALRYATQSLASELRATRAVNISKEVAPAENLTVFQKLAQATSRDEIASLTIDYAKNIWQRIMLLVERQNYLKVWAAGGSELTGRHDLATMKIPLHQTSQFRKCCYQAQPFLGTLSATSRLYDSFYTRLGGPLRPQRTVMIPIYVGKRVIGVFYADSGTGVPPTGDISELYNLIDAIGSGFENMISQKHRQFSSTQD